MKDDDVLKFIQPSRRVRVALNDGRVLDGTLTAEEFNGGYLYNIEGAADVKPTGLFQPLEDFRAEQLQSIEWLGH